MQALEKNYRYNGKELDEATGLYDYGARYYDPAIARMTTIDRFAEKYPAFSPYSYGAGNPLKYIDVNGDSLKITGQTRELVNFVSESSGGCYDVCLTETGKLSITENETLNVVSSPKQVEFTEAMITMANDSDEATIEAVNNSTRYLIGRLKPDRQ